MVSSSHYRFAVLLFVSLSALASISSFTSGKEAWGLGVGCFFGVCWACALGTPLHTHIMTALPAAIEGLGDEGRPGSVLVCIRIRSFSQFGITVDFYPRLGGLGGNNGQGIMDYGTVLQGQRATWVLA